MRSLRIPLAALLAASAVLVSQASSHREAPITALDCKADITDWFAFVSYDDPSKVTMIMNVDPLLEPAGGPNWYPFDDGILYEMKIDNDNDAREDVVFQFRFSTTQSAPNLFTVYAGTPGGAVAPSNSPPPVSPGTLIIPPRITAFTDLGHAQRQTYRVTMIAGGVRTELSAGRTLYTVSANVGPRTMDYGALYNAGTFDLANAIRVFAGTVDDPFSADLGAIFDTLNLRGSSTPGILDAAQDAAATNSAPDALSGFAVNAIAIEVPIELLTRDGQRATIGSWVTTSRRLTTIRRPLLTDVNFGPFIQVQRLGNPLINELAIGTGYKDRFSKDEPRNDSQFSQFFLDPSLARVVNAVTNGAVAIPGFPRLDLITTFLTGIPGLNAQPSVPPSDMLRLNTDIPATPIGNASRLGLLGGDRAGFPNGRRVFDDVTDIWLRLVVGGVFAAPFPGFNSEIGGRLGDGVNVNDVPFQNTFPYLGFAQSGRDHRHDGLPTPSGPKETDTSVTSSPNPSTFGESVTFTATVTSETPDGGTPTGNVTFNEGGVVLGTAALVNGQASISVSTLTVGTHTIEAIYHSGGGFALSGNDVSHTVNPAVSPTTTTLASTPNPSMFGQLVTFTATLSSPGGTPTGGVTFLDGTTVIGTASLDSSGRASIVISSLTVGTHNMTASYSGDANFNGSNSTSLHTVTRANTTITLNSSPNPSVASQPVGFTINATSTAGPFSGAVDVFNGTLLIGTAMFSNGVGTFTRLFTLPGTYNITVVFPGNATFNGTTSNVVSQVVNAPGGTTP